MKVGDEVQVKKGIQTPLGGWAGIARSSIGTVTELRNECVVVDFPEFTEWHGIESEMEHASGMYSVP